MRRWLRGCLVLAFLLVALAALAWPWVRPELEDRIVEALTEALGDLGSVATVELSLLPPRVALGGFAIVVPGDVEVAVVRAEATVVGVGLGGPAIAIDVLEPSVVLHVGEQPTDVELPATWPPFLQRVRLLGGTLDVEVPHLDLRARIRALDARVDVRGGRGDLVVTAAGEVARGETGVDISRLALAADVGSRSVTIRRAELSSDVGTAQATGRVSRRGLDGELALSVNLDRIDALTPELALGGVLELVGELGGTASAPDLEGRVRLRGFRIEDVEVSGPAAVRVRGSTWSLETAGLEIFGGSVEGSAEGEFGGGVPYVVTARPRAWRPSAFLAGLGVALDLRGTIDGAARLEGRLLEGEVEGTSDLRWTLGPDVVGGSVAFSVADGGSSVQALVGVSEDDRVKAAFHFGESGPAGSVEIRLGDLAAIGHALEIDLGGRDLEGRIDVEPDARGKVTVRGEATIEALFVDGIEVGPVRGPFAIAEGVLATDGIEVSAYNTEVRGRVALGAEGENDFRANVSGASLTRLAAVASLGERGWPSLSGTLFTEIEVLGPWGAPQANARGNLADVVVAGERIGGVYGGVLWSRDGWSVRGDLKLPAEATGHLEAHVDHEGRLTGVVEARDWRLDEAPVLRGQAVTLEGDLELSGTFGGTLERPSGVLDLSVGRVRFGGRAVPDLKADVTLDGESWRGRLALGESVALTGRGDLGGPAGFDVSGEWRAFDLGVFVLPGKSLAVVSTGKGSLRGRLDAPLGDGSVDLLELRIGQGRAEVHTEAPSQIRIRDGRVELDGLVLVADGRRFSISADLGSEASFVRAEGVLDLGILERVVPAVTSARGRLELDLETTRTGGGPWRTRGTAALTRGALDLDLLVGVRNLGGTATFDGDDLEIAEIVGDLGGGKIELRGGIRDRSRWDLDWTLTDASFGAPIWLDHVADGAGRLEGTLERPRLVGRIDLERAVYDRDVAWRELLPWFRRQSLTWKPPELPLDVDLVLVADGGLFIDNNLASLELSGRFSARGPADDLRLEGRLDVLDGTIGLRGREFDVTAGTVRFREEAPMNPSFELLGEATIRGADGDYDVRLHAQGTASDPRIELGTDDPTLTETDAVALLTFGKTVGQLRSESSSFEVFELLELTTEPMIGDVGRPIRDVIPVDRIEVQPSFSRTTGTTEPRVSVEKEIRPGLRATAGTTLGAARQQDASLEARITPRVGVRGRWESESESDGFGTFGGDVELRHPFWSLRELWEGSGP